jgi:hypothetical protein
VITLSLSPDGTISAFAEPNSPDDRGYYLDLPHADPIAFQRVIYQTLLRRAAARMQSTAEPIDVTAIAKWLETNPPTRPQAGAKGKPTVTLDMLKGLLP